MWGCGLHREDAVRSFIPGVYVRFSEHEFGKEFDTLDIKMLNASAGEFKITRRWRYERVGEDGKLQPEYKLTVTTVVYDPAHHILQERRYGKIYSFDMNAGCLFNGPNKFQKL